MLHRLAAGVPGVRGGDRADVPFAAIPRVGRAVRAGRAHGADRSTSRCRSSARCSSTATAWATTAWAARGNWSGAWPCSRCCSCWRTCGCRASATARWNGLWRGDHLPARCRRCGQERVAAGVIVAAGLREKKTARLRGPFCICDAVVGSVDVIADHAARDGVVLRRTRAVQVGRRLQRGGTRLRVGGAGGQVARSARDTRCAARRRGRCRPRPCRPLHTELQVL